MILNSTMEVLGHLERGDLSKDLFSEIQKVLASLAEHGEGAGTVTLKIRFKAKEEMVSISATLDSTIPKRERRTSTAFITPDGRLSLQHPQQVDMFSGARRDAIDA